MSRKDEISSLIKKIAEDAVIYRRYFELDELVPQFGKPASKNNIDKIKSMFSGDLPEDYIDLISLHDGIKNFDAPDMEILSTDFLTKNPGVLEEVFVNANRFDKGEIFIVFQEASDPHSVAFRRSGEGRVTVIDFDAQDDIAEFDTLLDYLNFRSDDLRKAISRFEADRKGLLDD
ncbi:SMI1/KNR4 family protein [Mesorhizobium sp.]|uniref:SMI1/KNR4 family protein n=1 Tax=Mesorhizobium sp. TaxID=1871066 RepID=UPI000FE5717F|nr:SMI1/KNR4 family protein [Mesorhizobium sp.]RWP60251.1 MAG: SMI1/KNR4 family protein [Mesorhizobium sp.]